MYVCILRVHYSTIGQLSYLGDISILWHFNHTACWLTSFIQICHFKTL